MPEQQAKDSRDRTKDRPVLEASGRPSTLARVVDTLRLVLDTGGPGFCQFAINNACNANCGFCNFARDRLPKDTWHFVTRPEGLEAIRILYREGIRYLVFTGGEPTLHADLVAFIRYAAGLGMTVMVVTNGGLLKPEKISEMADAGLSRSRWMRPHRKSTNTIGACPRV
jgi:pyruvate-formate lyase-activating enzyme